MRQRDGLGHVSYDKTAAARCPRTLLLVGREWSEGSLRQVQKGETMGKSAICPTIMVYSRGPRILGPCPTSPRYCAALRSSGASHLSAPVSDHLEVGVLVLRAVGRAALEHPRHVEQRLGKKACASEGGHGEGQVPTFSVPNRPRPRRHAGARPQTTLCCRSDAGAAGVRQLLDLISHVVLATSCGPWSRAHFRSSCPPTPHTEDTPAGS